MKQYRISTRWNKRIGVDRRFGICNTAGKLITNFASLPSLVPSTKLNSKLHVDNVYFVVYYIHEFYLTDVARFLIAALHRTSTEVASHPTWMLVNRPVKFLNVNPHRHVKINIAWPICIYALQRILLYPYDVTRVRLCVLPITHRSR